MVKPHAPIKTVVRRTGLSAHVIRIWEKRYQAVVPERTGTNRRLYSEEQIERLMLLRELTQGGHSIGPIATLATDKLRQLVARSDAAPLPSARVSARVSARTTGAVRLLEDCLSAVQALDAPGLEAALGRAGTELGAQGLLQRVIGPLSQRIGDLWREGTITAAHEHFASAVIRVFLGHAAKPFAGTEHAPGLIVATPAGQIHELGALLAGAAAANVGWRVTYLGASLPAAEIAGAARQNQARAVALSLVYPEDDPRLEGELVRLRAALPPDVTVLVGGRAAAAYAPALKKIGARPCQDLTQLCAVLDECRVPVRKPKR